MAESEADPRMVEFERLVVAAGNAAWQWALKPHDEGRQLASHAADAALLAYFRAQLAPEPVGYAVVRPVADGGPLRWCTGLFGSLGAAEAWAESDYAHPWCIVVALVPLPDGEG